MLYGLASWLNGKESAGDSRATGSVAGSRGGNGNLHQYSCLEHSVDSRAWQATCSSWGHKQSDVTEYACKQISAHPPYFIFNYSLKSYLSI